MKIDRNELELHGSGSAETVADLTHSGEYRGSGATDQAIASIKRSRLELQAKPVADLTHSGSSICSLQFLTCSISDREMLGGSYGR